MIGALSEEKKKRACQQSQVNILDLQHSVIDHQISNNNRNSNVNYCCFPSATSSNLLLRTTQSCSATVCLLLAQIHIQTGSSLNHMELQKIKMIVYLTLFLYSENSAIKLNYFPSFLDRSLTMYVRKPK